MNRSALGTRLLGALTALSLAACGSPPVAPAADVRDDPVKGSLSGQVVVSGAPRGNVVLFLYDAERPPSPRGTGRPVAVQLVTAAQLFGQQLRSPDALGPFAAPFTFPYVGPGRYLVSAVLDGNDCLAHPDATCRVDDLNPFFTVTREPNGRDLVGGHVDAKGALTPVEVLPAGADGIVAAVRDIGVGLGRSVPDRPVFRVAEALPPSAQGGPAYLRLVTQAIDDGAVVQQKPAFLLRYQDQDGDGRPDVDAATGLPKLWPRVILRKLAEPTEGMSANLATACRAGLRDENDLDDDGRIDTQGTSYAHRVGTAEQEADATPDLVVLASAFPRVPAGSDPRLALVPSQLYAQLADAQGNADVNKVVPLTELPVAVLPLAVDAIDSASPVPLTQVPPGRYAVVVQQFTGQTWRLPNELSPATAGPAGLPIEESQGFTFEVR